MSGYRNKFNAYLFFDYIYFLIKLIDYVLIDNVLIYD